jgi:hypothetical protein
VVREAFTFSGSDLKVSIATEAQGEATAILAGTIHGSQHSSPNLDKQSERPLDRLKRLVGFH